MAGHEVIGLVAIFLGLGMLLSWASDWADGSTFSGPDYGRIYTEKNEPEKYRSIINYSIISAFCVLFFGLLLFFGVLKRSYAISTISAPPHSLLRTATPSLRAKRGNPEWSVKVWIAASLRSSQ